MPFLGVYLLKLSFTFLILINNKINKNSSIFIDSYWRVEKGRKIGI